MPGRPKKSIDSLLLSMAARDEKMKRRGKAQSAKPFLFTKIPRTASESMHGVLSECVCHYVRINQADHARAFYSSHPRSLISVCHNHTPVAGLLKHGSLPAVEFQRRYSFTFIRNPWTRLLSIYNLLTAWEANGKKTLLHGCSSLDDFVKMLGHSRYAAGQQSSLKFFLTSPQWTWVYPFFSFVGRYECLADDWRAVNDSLGINVPLNRHSKLYVKTPAMAVPAEFQYSKWALKEVGRIYEADCFLGGYEGVNDRCRLTSSEILSRALSVWKSAGVVH